MSKKILKIELKSDIGQLPQDLSSLYFSCIILDIEGIPYTPTDSFKISVHWMTPILFMFTQVVNWMTTHKLGIYFTR